MIGMIRSMKQYSQTWYIGYAAQGGVGLGLAPIFLPVMVAAAFASGVGNTKAGIIVAVFYFGQLFSPVFGYLADKLNWHRIIYIGSFILVGIGMGCFPFFQDMVYWIIMAMCMGLGIGAANTVAEMFIVEFQPQSEWDNRVSWLQMFFGVGQAVGLFAAFFLSNYINLAFYVSGIAMLPSLIIGLIQLPQIHQRNRVKRTKENPVVTPVKSRSFGHSMRHLPYAFVALKRIGGLFRLKNLISLFKSLFLLYMTAWVFVMLGNWLIYNLYPLLMKSVFDVSTSMASLTFAIGATAAIPACPLSGWLANKIGEVWVLIIGMILSLIAGLGMFLCYLFPFTGAVYVASAAFICLPIAWSPLVIIGTALVTRMSSMSQGESMGIFTSATAGASLVAAIAAGYIADTLGFDMVLLISAIMTVISLGLIFILKGILVKHPV